MFRVPIEETVVDCAETVDNQTLMKVDGNDRSGFVYVCNIIAHGDNSKR